MERIKKFGIDLEGSSASPYHQVPSSQRIGFEMELIENGNTKIMTSIIDNIFKSNESIDTTFMIGYFENNVRVTFRLRLGKFFRITNWKEKIIHNEDTETLEIFATIRKLRKDDVIKYCKGIAKGSRDAEIMFYNDQFLVFITSDVFDVISYDEDYIKGLKQKYDNLYSKFNESYL